MSFLLIALSLLGCLVMVVDSVRVRAWHRFVIGLALGAIAGRLIWVPIELIGGSPLAVAFDYATIVALLGAFGLLKSRELREARKFSSDEGGEPSKHSLAENTNDEQSQSLELQIAERDRQLKRLKSQLVDWRQSQCEFVSSLSQEVRQPLAAILGLAEILTETTDIQAAQEIGQTVNRTGHEMLDLLADCIDLTNLESGKVRADRKAFGPRQTIDEVAQAIAERAKSKGLEFRLEYEGLLPEVATADASRLRQVLFNLGANAVRFTEQGSVAIKVAMDDMYPGEPCLEIAVSDTGIGISEELQDRLFLPFSKGLGKSQRLSGTGLGLAICRRLVDILGGTIEVDSELDQGSCFTVRVPIETPPNVPMIDPYASRSPREADVTRPLELKSRVLVVDGCRDSQKLVSFVLKKAGAKVELADNGAQGVTAILKADAEGSPFEIVIMDISLPVYNGLDATAHLRSIGYTGLIIALTAMADEGTRKRCIDAGYDDYLVKPVDRKLLLQVVADLGMRTVEMHCASEVPI